MEEDTKKISFSFKQVSTKPKIVPVVSKSSIEKSVDFIECVEEKEIKVVGLIENVENELIIPMQPSVKRRLPAKCMRLKQNDSENISLENRTLTLDELAVQAILTGCHNNEEKEDPNIIELPMIVNPPEGKEVSTLEDYKNIPVDKFGIAMLCGMGWKSNEGADKNAKEVITNLPEIRPKGMGLGADKLVKRILNQLDSEEKLELKDGSYVQFIIGRLNGQYGQVKGFDEGDSRVMVKIARTGQIAKVNENAFCVVTKNNYDKNSRVINIKEYHEFHENKNKLDDGEDQIHHHERKSKRDLSSDQQSRSRHHKTKKSKHSKSPHRKHKSDHNRHRKYKHERSSS